MAIQRGQRNEGESKISNVGLLVCFATLYVIFSIAMSFVIAAAVQSYLMGCAISFTLIGFVFYFGVHYLLPREMAKIDTRLVHELAKRRLVEFCSIEEDSRELA
jgi:hypothetical protein